ncbi:MAG: glycosyltransferase [Erysipelotrichaceae bacterium]
MIIKMILDNGFDPDVRVYNEAKYLANCGHEIEILCYDGRSKFVMKPTETIEGFRVKRFFLRSKFGTFLTDRVSFKFRYIYYPLWFIKFYYQIKHYLNRKEIDYIYSHDLFCAFMSTLFFPKVKKVFDMHELYKKSEKNFIYNGLCQHLVNYTQRNSDIIVYVNEVQKDVIENKSWNKMYYLPNYAILENYSTNKSLKKYFTVSYIGLVRRDDLILNLCEAAAKIDNCKIEVHGKGLTDFGNKSMKMYQNCNYFGEYNGTLESRTLFEKCNLLYCVYDINDINWRQAIPVKFYEAMASGTPVIVSESSKCGDLVKEFDLGYTCKWDDVEGIKKCIKSAMTNKKEYEKKRINCINIGKEYSLKTVTSKLSSTLEDLLDENN